MCVFSLTRSGRFLPVAAILGAAASGSAEDLSDRFDRYLASHVERNGVPGLTAAVVRGGHVIHAGAHGVREVGKEEELATRHVFRLASVSKPFVATAIVQFVEQGRLHLDDPVTRTLPYFSPRQVLAVQQYAV